MAGRPRIRARRPPRPRGDRLSGIQRPDGPYFDDLRHGDVLDPGPLAPAATLTDGLAAAHQVIVGDRLPIALSIPLSTAVAGGRLAHPALVWDIAIGQSTAITRRVIANVFYRGLAFHRMPEIGDTLSTRTEVVGLRQNRSRPSGLAALRVTSVDQDDRIVLDFWRCAMLPLSSADVDTGHADDLDAVGGPASGTDEAVAHWDLSAMPAGQGRPEPGEVRAVEAGDLVSSAEMARLTLNLAAVHHDLRAGGGRRLVYGGHTIGLALAQACRAVPGLVTVLAWQGCDHTGSVHEGDTVFSTVTVGDVRRRDGGGWCTDLHSVMYAVSAPQDEPRAVLDWRFTALVV